MSEPKPRFLSDIFVDIFYIGLNVYRQYIIFYLLDESRRRDRLLVWVYSMIWPSSWKRYNLQYIHNIVVVSQTRFIVPARDPDLFDFKDTYRKCPNFGYGPNFGRFWVVLRFAA